MGLIARHDLKQDLSIYLSFTGLPVFPDIETRWGPFLFRCSVMGLTSLIIWQQTERRAYQTSQEGQAADKRGLVSYSL
jgi:hypothetical protein